MQKGFGPLTASHLEKKFQQQLGETEDRFTGRLAEMEARTKREMDRREDGLLAQVIQEFDRRFEDFEERIDKKFEARFDKLEERMGRLEKRMNQLETRFDKLEALFDKLEARFDKIEDLLLKALSGQGPINA